MRLVEAAAFLGFLVGCGALARALWRRASPGPERWAAFHRFEGDRRRVYVRRGGELEPVGEVASGAADYDERFLQLMADARERAAVLNSEDA